MSPVLKSPMLSRDLLERVVIWAYLALSDVICPTHNCPHRRCDPCTMCEEDEEAARNREEW